MPSKRSMVTIVSSLRTVSNTKTICPGQGCQCRYTACNATPCSGYRFTPEVIALTVRRYLRFRLGYADVAELLAEWGLHVDPSTVFAWVREFAALYARAGASTRPIGK